MAQLALSAGGAVVGGLIGGPWGASIGWTLGGLAGAALFPPKGADIQGPKLSDLSVDSSAYGTGIPIVFGTTVLAGNRIWALPLDQVGTTRRVGGKGGRRQKETTYSYYGNWAVGLCAGVAAGVRRIWFDDKLVFDATGASLQLTLSSLTFRFYPGSEDQLPDPLIEASVGADRAPAHRGLAYLVFERVPLDRLGNRVPVVRAEVVMNGADVSTIAAFGAPTGTGTVMWSITAYDWDLRRVFTYRQSPAAICVTNMDTLTSEKFADAVYGGIPRHMLRVGKYVCLTTGANNNVPIQIYDAFSGVWLRDFGGFAGGAAFNSVTNFSNGDGPRCGVIVYDSTGTERHFAILQPFVNSMGSYCIDLDLNAYVWGIASNALFSVPFGGRWVQGEQRRDETDVMHLVGSGGSVALMRVTLTIATRGVGSGALEGATEGTPVQLLPSLTAAQLGLAAGTLTVHSASYDLEDGTFIAEVSSSGGGSARLCKLSRKGELFWTAPIAATSGGDTQSLLRNGTYAVLGSDQQYLHSTRDGSLLVQTSASYLPAGVQVYDADRQAVWNNFNRILVGRQSSATVTLASVVQSLATRAGLTVGDLNTSALTDAVRGYVIARPMSARAALEPLAAAFLFDAVESDDQLKFVKRGGASAMTIEHAEMVREGDDAVIVRQRAQDLELPRTLTVRHFDPERGYEVGTQRHVRPKEPTPVMSSRADEVMDLALVLSPSEAKTIARRLLTATWRERTRYTFKGSTRHLRLEPSDPITIQLADGSSTRARVISTTLGANWVVEVEAVGEDATDYSLVATGYGGEGRLPDVLPIVMPARAFAPSLPLLRDADDAPGSLRTYAFAGGFENAGTFYGVDLWLDEGGGFRFEDSFLNAAPWGSLTSVLAPPANYWAWDDVSTITFRPVYGAAQIEGATDIEVLNGANLAAVVAPTGAVELIRFGQAALQGDGTIVLSRLLRGVRGTDDAGTLPVGSTFILLEETDIALRSSLTLLNGSHSIKAVPPSLVVSQAATVSRTLTGRAEQPYSPVQLAGARDGSNNLTLTWKRRTRIGGELVDNVDVVPLGEASEAYEVQIRNLGNTTTLRTITGLTSPTCAYSAANQTSDGYTPGAPVTFRVRQISATVGGGIWGVATI